MRASPPDPARGGAGRRALAHLAAGLLVGAALGTAAPVRAADPQTVPGRAVAAAKEARTVSQQRAATVNAAAAPTTQAATTAPAKAGGTATATKGTPAVPAKAGQAPAPPDSGKAVQAAPAKAGAAPAVKPGAPQTRPAAPDKNSPALAKAAAGGVPARAASMRPTLTTVPGRGLPHLDDHQTYTYDALGRRDPFQPLIGGLEYVDDNAPPEVGGLKVVGIVWGTEDKFALVEDARGNSYVLRRGDKVMNGIVEGLRREALVVNITLDGQSQSVTIPLTRKGDSNANR